MPVNFPSAPSLNQTYTYNNVVWTWTGNRWEVQHNYDMQGVYFTYSNAAPASPRLGDRWLYSESLVELVYVYDGTSYQWVEVSSQAGAGAVRDLSNLITTSINASLVPASNVTYDLGSSSLRWRDLYLSGNTIDLGGTAIKSSANGVSFTSVANAAAAVPLTVSSLQIASATGNVVTLQATATGLQTVGTTGNVVATTPGGSSGQLQYNLAGAFAGAANVVYASTGQLLRGASSARTNWLGGGGAIGFQNEGLDAVSGSMGTVRGGVNGFPAYLIIGKTRSATVGGSDAVVNNDLIGTLDFQAADGTNMIRTASIGAAVDGTVSTGVVPGRLAIFTANAGGVLTERVRLDSSGNLGIGTGSPSARLHINGTSDATQRIIVNGTGNFSSYKLNYNGSEVAFIQSYQNTELNFGTAVNAPILFYVNNAEQMRLNTTGLGIGTSSPGAKLTVDITRTTSGAYDGILVTGTQTNNIGGGNNYALTVAAAFANSSAPDRLAQIYVKNPSLSGAAVAHSVRGISIDKISGGNQGSAQIYLANNTSGGAFNSISGQYALYSDNTADSYIAGNVGIGTTSPSTLLHVNGATTLGGTVNLSGVKIRDTSGTAKVYYNVTPGYDYYSSGSTAGAIVIDTNIPALTAGTMFNIKIAGYDYNRSAPYEVSLGVYCGENNIYSRGYSGTSIPFTSIRYARKTATGMLSIILGAVGDIVPISIVVERVIQNFSNLTLAQIDGWTISRITSTAAYDNINTVTGGSTGVPFLPTQFASSDPNVLDDYEEGTWTTTFNTPWNLTGTPTLDQAIYTKVGRLVTITGRITGYSITSTNTATYPVINVPFPMVANQAAVTGSVFATSGATYLSGTAVDNSSGDNTSVAILIPAVGVTVTGSVTFIFTITYMTT